MSARVGYDDLLFIDGEWRPSNGDARIDLVCPSTEELVGQVASATPHDVGAAVAAARRSFDDRRWSSLPLEDRIAVVQQAADAVTAMADDVGLTVTTEMGQPIVTSTGLARQLGATAGFLGDLARSFEQIRYDDGPAGPAAVVHEPVGVVAGVAPWNGPMGTAMSKICMPLLAGCSVVYKPAPETPFSVRFLVDALVDAGLPAGVVNVVTGRGETGTALVSHPDVDKVSFTGSTTVGRTIGEIAGRGFKRLQLELGGKSAAVVLDDADMDVVQQGLMVGSFFNTGQVCAALTRVLAPRSRYDEVVAAVSESAGRWVLGDPFDPATTLGPVAGQRHRERIEGYVRGAVADGATAVLGGGRPEGFDRGWYVEPTILVGVTNDMTIAREEVFGPVVVVIPHDGDGDAVRLANDSPYGLHGAVFTTSPDRAVDVARRVRTGTFTVNGFRYNNRAPFGGVKASGVGRDTGREGYASFWESKTINLPKRDADRYTASLSAS